MELQCTFVNGDGTQCDHKCQKPVLLCHAHLPNTKANAFQNFDMTGLGSSMFEIAIVFSPSEFKCKYCDLAIKLLENSNYEVVVTKLSNKDLEKQFGLNFTVPQIFIGNRRVGGFSDLKRELKVV